MANNGHQEYSESPKQLLGSGFDVTKSQNGAGSIRQRAGGPRTTQGKARSRQNSLSHGIFAKTVILRDESEAEFDALLNGLREHFQPVGTFEDGLVESLAVTRWRQRRLLVAEAAEIELGKRFIEWDETQRQLEEATRFPQVSINGGLIRRICNAEALECFLTNLRHLKIGIEQNGLDAERDHPILTKLYGQLDEERWQVDLLWSYQAVSRVLELPETLNKSNNWSPEECKSYFLSELNKEIKRLERREKDQEAISRDRLRLEALRRNVPDSPRLDQLLRYSASLERSFDRALNQLERAQRMRLGQPVPPPINVSVSPA
jgi:hypothetical protein